MILFLNKEDLLREKIDAGVSKIEKYFSSYADYSVANSQVLDESKAMKARRTLCMLCDNV